jgi:hypothetical protein
MDRLLLVSLSSNESMDNRHDAIRYVARQMLLAIENAYNHLFQSPSGKKYESVHVLQEVTNYKGDVCMRIRRKSARSCSFGNETLLITTAEY